MRTEPVIGPTMTNQQRLVYKECEPSFSILDWELHTSLKWMEENWYYTTYVSIVYMLVVYSIQQFMRTREPFKLRKCLTLWNIGLTIFSMAGSYYMIQEMYDALYVKGLDHSVCMASTNPTSQYWMWLFALSKIFELGDTIFIVLRKQKLIFLHWFHHILALTYTWYSYGQNISLGRWFVTMNLVVHSLMYGYYAFKSLQVYIPRQISIFITSLQIIQMIIGFYVSSYAFFTKLMGNHCEIPMKTATFGFFVYVTFFLMFARLFVNNYIKKISRSTSSRPSEKTSESTDKCQLKPDDNWNYVPSDHAENDDKKQL